MAALNKSPANQIEKLKNLSVIINGYRQLGFEFEDFSKVKDAILSKIEGLAKGEKETTTNDVEVLRVALYEFSALEFDDNDRENIFNALVSGFVTNSKTDKPFYFSKFGDLVETVDYLLNSTDVKLKEFCKAIRARKAQEEGKTGKEEVVIIAELDTLLDKFGCPPEPLKPDSKQKV